MSFQAKHELTRARQLEVQELVISTLTPELAVVSGSDLIVLVREEVKEAVCAILIDGTTPKIYAVAAAAMSVVDSVAYTAGGDKKAIKLAGVALAAGDAVILKFICHQ